MRLQMIAAKWKKMVVTCLSVLPHWFWCYFSDFYSSYMTCKGFL